MHISLRAVSLAGLVVMCACAAPLSRNPHPDHSAPGRPVSDHSVHTAASAVIEFRGGQWFDGSGFQTREVYSIDGHFSFDRPSRIDDVVDLGGGYALPPFGEAHNHNFTGPWGVDALISRYIEAGVFYVQNPANVPEYRAAIPGSALNTPRSIDVAFSNGAITGPRGHPIGLYEDILRERYYAQRAGPLPRGWFEGKSYHVVSNSADLDTLWPRLLNTKPDFIKIILAYSEDHERNLSDPSPLLHRGLSPILARDVVRRAHSRGLRVVAHTETAGDFRAALDAEVDQIAHLPGYNIPSVSEEYRFILTEADGARAARQRLSVATTTALSQRVVRDSSRLRLVRQRQRSNLRVLKTAGVEVIVGSDNVDDVGSAEFDNLASLGVFTNAELLRLWSETTPRAIFPNRRIGRIAEGYEASFVVLPQNPLERLNATDQIARRFKQGVEIEVSRPPTLP